MDLTTSGATSQDWDPIEQWNTSNVSNMTSSLVKDDEENVSAANMTAMKSNDSLEVVDMELEVDNETMNETEQESAESLYGTENETEDHGMDAMSGEMYGNESVNASENESVNSSSNSSMVLPARFDDMNCQGPLSPLAVCGS